MSKTLAVFGATGKQGGSVINNVLNDPELSQKYKLRAITRDANSDAAKALKAKNVEVVSADMQNKASLEAALGGAHFVYIMTTPSFGPDAVETELNTAKMIADSAVAKDLEYIIFSTLPSVSGMSGGKYTHVTAFDAKAKAEEYIRGLPIKSAFTSLGYFMENLSAQPFLAPQPTPDGTYVFARPVSSKIRVPYLDASQDVGKFVGAILASPDKYVGKRFIAAQALYSLEEIVAAMEKNTGKAITYKQISFEEFGKSMPFVPELWVDGWHAQEEFGYFGLGRSEEKEIAWAVAQVRGKLTTLHEFLEAHPLQLA